MLHVLPRRTWEPVLGAVDVHVSCQHPAVPVDHGLGHHRGAEAIRLADDPAAQHATTASAGDEHVLVVDVSSCNHRVYAGHEVVVVEARIGVVDQIAELLSVAGAAPRVGVQHHIPGGCVELNLGGEAIAVVGERPAVNFEEQRILVAGIEIGRLHNPTLNAAPIV